jgi:hypothetical protein
VCPQQLITTQDWIATPQIVSPLIRQGTIQALEIHTQVGHLEAFEELWQVLKADVRDLQLLAISCPDHPNLIPYLQDLANLVLPTPEVLIWQTDGRPMSGDLGKGTTHATVKLAQKVLAARLPGYVQLAGGTNQHTVMKLRQLGLLKGNRAVPHIAGVAYGSYARSRLSSVLTALQESDPANASLQAAHIEETPDLLWQAVALAASVVGQIKTSLPQPSQLPLIHTL